MKICWFDKYLNLISNDKCHSFYKGIIVRDNRTSPVISNLGEKYLAFYNSPCKHHQAKTTKNNVQFVAKSYSKQDMLPCSSRFIPRKINLMIKNTIITHSGTDMANLCGFIYILYIIYIYIMRSYLCTATFWHETNSGIYIAILGFPGNINTKNLMTQSVLIWVKIKKSQTRPYNVVIEHIHFVCIKPPC